MELLRPAADGYDRHVAELNGACAFCAMSADLDVGEYPLWKWVFAAFPYRKYHTLLVPKRHVEDFSELTPEELAGLSELTSRVERAYRESGIVGEKPALGGHLVFSWRHRVALDPAKVSLRHLHLHAYPRPDGQGDVDREEGAWDVDVRVFEPFA
jgi:diadenosine tetraphosphate (Ap4A) HIT family hydrolase